MERNNFLDCIRTMAVFLVVAVHSHLLVGGRIGVSIFFCLSGYLIATILLQIDPSPANLGKFVSQAYANLADDVGSSGFDRSLDDRDANSSR